MATRTWIGGSNDWSNAGFWQGAPANTPQFDDTLLVSTGNVLLPGVEAPFNGSYEAWLVTLGSAFANAPAVITATSAAFSKRFAITSTGAAAFATFTSVGANGYAGSINASTSGGTFTIDATQPNGGQASEFVLRHGGLITVSGGDTMVLDGTLLNHSTIEVNAGGAFANTGTVNLVSGLFDVASGGTLAGAGTIGIGLFSTLFLEPGSAATNTPVAVRPSSRRLPPPS